MIAFGKTLAAVAVAAAVATPAAAAPAAQQAGGSWYTSWSSSQQGLSGTTLTNQSVRMITHLSQGGRALRIRVQNQFGTEALQVNAGTVALSTGQDASIVEGTTQALTFGGKASISVAPGTDAWSDSVKLETQPQQDVAVSLYVPGSTRPGQHGAAFRTNYATPAGSGNHVADQAGAAYTQTTTSTWLVSAVDVRNTKLAGTIVTYGSSVVDGEGSTNCGAGCVRTGNNERWSDVLARRIVAEAPAKEQVAVANAGINGTMSATGCPGASPGVAGLEAATRLERDVLALHGVTGVIYYYGTNDLAAGCTSAQILDSWRTVFGRLHAAGIKVYLIPTTPRPSYTEQMNRYRWDLGNYAWNRNNCGGDCDGVINFDQVIKDPINPNAINKAYDVGDGIHVNIAAQVAEGQSIDVGMLSTR
ncbi:GDSL-type esterase/lipase family protein [Actinoplanes sp. TFC3]|uniref:GDSL-type esterase/lipase family protein n=1 Tax=Actinoplanes sp. TFC3 TaxID=1710355 RepID=UPI00082B1B73|nr:GDSL-type esterase/lipase family protein [Actinoplanes sp. TFC3]